MSFQESNIRIATRGSALALAQAKEVQARGQTRFPDLRFELKIIKTTGDKLQSASLTNPDGGLPKGLFTKEIEEALLRDEADLAVHSLKDLPTQLPDGLELGATLEREDVRDVLVFKNHSGTSEGPLPTLKKGAVVATSSTRRRSQILDRRPDLKVVEIRGNVGTRLRKLAEQEELDVTILAFAGLTRLGYQIDEDGILQGDGIPSGLHAVRIALDDVLPCVGQAAIGLEIRQGDSRLAEVCRGLKHLPTWHAVTAERSFLRAMGGGCQAPVAAYAQTNGDRVAMKVVSFFTGSAVRAEDERDCAEADELGRALAKKVSH